MRNLVFLLIVISFIGCDDSDELGRHFHDFTGMDFSIVNSIGEDLLNPEHRNYFNEN